jgi:YD repeat-containing protein
VSEEETPEGFIHYEYDDLGRHASTWTANSATTTETNATTRIDYGYDALGRLSSATTLRLNSTGVKIKGVGSL